MVVVEVEVVGDEVVVGATVVVGARVVVGATLVDGARVVAGSVLGVVLVDGLCVLFDPPVARSTMMTIRAMTAAAPTATATHLAVLRFCGR
jgi:hypothetical protein